MFIVLFLVKAENRIWISLAFDENTIKNNKKEVLEKIKKLVIDCEKKYTKFEIKKLTINFKDKNIFENLFIA